LYVHVSFLLDSDTDLDYQIDPNAIERILKNLHCGLYFVDRHRVITYWNKAAEEIAGYTSDEVMGKSCSDNLLIHIDADTMDSIIERVEALLYKSKKDGPNRLTMG